MKRLPHPSQYAWQCLFMPLALAQIYKDRDVWLGGSNYQFSNEAKCGESVFGVVNGGGNSLLSSCGAKLETVEDFQDVCIANLFGGSFVLPAVVDDAQNIGYHTIFELETPSYPLFTTKVTLIRFTAQYQTPYISESVYFITVPPDVFNSLRCGTGQCRRDFGFAVTSIRISPLFFTDYKLTMSNDLVPETCSTRPDCTSELCVYFRMAANNHCQLPHKGYFGIRVKPEGILDVFKTVEVSRIEPRGTYSASRGTRGHFYYIKESELGPLIRAASCTAICRGTHVTYCSESPSCETGFVARNYDGTGVSNLVSDYGYILPYNRDLKCGDLTREDGVASSNIVFDELMGGRPRCDCVDGYRWNVMYQICEPLCDNKCGVNEECLTDNHGVQKCECKDNHARLWPNGSCRALCGAATEAALQRDGRVKCLCQHNYVMYNDDTCQYYPGDTCRPEMGQTLRFHENQFSCSCREEFRKEGTNCIHGCPFEMAWNGLNCVPGYEVLCIC